MLGFWWIIFSLGCDVEGDGGVAHDGGEGLRGAGSSFEHRHAPDCPFDFPPSGDSATGATKPNPNAGVFSLGAVIGRQHLVQIQATIA